MSFDNILSHIKVLYVEDDPITRSVNSKVLKAHVGKLILAENGADGLKKFLLTQPDVLITDLVMPDMNGLDLVKKIRMEGYHCPVMITTSLDDAKTILEAVDLKIDKYLIKPVEDKVLIHSLVNVSIQLLEGKKNMLFLKGDILASKEERIKVETEIRNLCAGYLKKYFGKGAKNIQVFINGQFIELTFQEPLTILEQSVLSTGPHYKAIEVIRRLVYDSTLEILEEEISKAMSRKIITQAIDIDTESSYDRLTLKIVT